ncbi:unnamed protein product [Rotaria sp. Silwood1]|nr:unnamed protein product [Rotaria sp. Silwood1]CAF1688703.1 unnamed protein product [Rotaria sp. Silwood1]CAF4979957.1 unnamed protein product [Rotaria sp. Silwood1]CAF5109165.1 unnamed protein product [Rotaria sp. Silwood1]
MKQWSTKNTNYLTATKRVEYDLPPKFISNANLTFKIDESIISKEEAQIIFLQENNEGFDIEPDAGYIAFKHYNELREKGRSQRARRNCGPDSHTIVGRGFLAPTIINEAQAKLTEEEYQLLKLGSRFIYNDPQTASRRCTTELAMLKRKIEAQFFEKKVSPGRSVEQFIAELDVLLKNLHDTPISKINRKYKQQREIISYDNLLETIQLNQYQITKCPIITVKKKNYGRLVKRLKHKLRSTSIVLQKSDKSKVFHLDKLQDYHKKSDEYMEKTEADKCLHQNDPLPSLIDRINKYLLNLRLTN